MVNRPNAASHSNNEQVRRQPVYPPPPPPFSSTFSPKESDGIQNGINAMGNDRMNNQPYYPTTPFPTPVAPNSEPKESTSLLDRLNLLKSSNAPLLRQLITRLLPGVLVPLTIVTGVRYVIESQNATQEAERILEEEALSLGEVTSELVKQAQEIPSIIATNPLILAETRNAAAYAQVEGLVGVAPEQLDQQFGENRQLRPNPTLDGYLKRTGEITGVPEFLLTEKHGFTIAYSNLPSDFMQGDDGWWLKSKELGEQYSQQSFDESANTLGFEIIQPILDPISGEFLGVLETVVPSEFFQEVLALVGTNAIFESLETQVIAPDDEGKLAPVSTITREGISQGQEVLGGEAVAERIAVMSQLKTEQAESLEAAAKTAGFPLTIIQHASGESGLSSRLSYEGREYILSTIPNTNWVAVVSVEKAEINAKSQDTAIAFLITLLIDAVIVSAIVVQVARQLSSPLTQLTGTANQVAAGNLNVYARPEGSAETVTLATSFNNLLNRVKLLLQAQTAETERSQILRDITLEITQAPTLDAILTQFAITRVRQAINADRVIVYRFDENWQGTVITESVGNNWTRSLGVQIHDPCFTQGYVERYKRGRIQAISNIYTAGLTECHLKQLEPFAVKANLVAPIKQNDQLIGLLIAHQCSAPREWEKLEVDFFAQVATQLGLALERRDLINQTEAAAEQSRQAAEEQRQQKEALQMQLVELLSDVEEVANGDLTVRADVSAGEIGTVADFFNSIIESLRSIVTKVKQSAVQVNNSLGENEFAIRQLADEALQQAEETTRTLNSVEQMTQSIQMVAERAGQAAQVARTASATAATGGTAMDLTVQNILNLRETVGETAKKVKRLGESSQQISKVVSLINQIALQTNLLAINAGIEAARAGEEGQGFAVVAEEVGELAARAAAATQEIERIVDSIRTETSQVVEAMEQSTAQVVEGTHRVEEAKESLSQILEVSRQIDQLVQSISEATVSQVQTSETVSKLMQEVALVSKKTSDSSLQVSTALRQTVEVAQELQDSVGTFKVGA
jgi:methyl-accepting chemotaxis protein